MVIRRPASALCCIFLCALVVAIASTSAGPPAPSSNVTLRADPPSQTGTTFMLYYVLIPPLCNRFGVFTCFLFLEITVTFFLFWDF